MTYVPLFSVGIPYSQESVTARAICYSTMNNNISFPAGALYINKINYIEKNHNELYIRAEAVTI